jgi:hypothetical protein
MDVVRTALWKGCLGGFGLAILYVVIGGLAYIILSQLNLSYNLVLLVAIASGPVFGTGGLLAVLYWHARRAHQSMARSDDENN